MKTNNLAEQIGMPLYSDHNQQNEVEIDSYRPKKGRKVAAVCLTALSLTVAACSVSKPTSEHSAKLAIIHPISTLPKQNVASEKVAPTTTTTIPPQEAYPSGEFIGAIELKRLNPSETGYSDSKVIHRLNDGIWTITSHDQLSVNPNPMLVYGPVFNQNTAPIGTPGETSVIAAHDVTPINAPVTLNGVTYNQPEVTRSVSAQSDEYDPYAGIGNMVVGDEIIVYLNNPHNPNTEEVYTYKINERYIINPNNVSQVQALGNPPASKTESQLTYYDCWPQYTANDREVLTAGLISTDVENGHVSFGESEPPVYSTNIQ